MAKNSSLYNVSGRITDQQGKPSKTCSSTPSTKMPIRLTTPWGNPFLPVQGKYSNSFIEEDFKIGAKESGGPDVFIWVYAGEELLGESKPLRNVGRKETINVTVEKQVQEEPPQPALTARQEFRLRDLREVLKTKNYKPTLKQPSKNLRRTGRRRLMQYDKMVISRR